MSAPNFLQSNHILGKTPSWHTDLLFHLIFLAQFFFLPVSLLYVFIFHLYDLKVQVQQYIPYMNVLDFFLKKGNDQRYFYFAFHEDIDFWTTNNGQPVLLQPPSR